MEVKTKNATGLNWSSAEKVKILITPNLENHLANVNYNLSKIFFSHVLNRPLKKINMEMDDTSEF